MELISAVDGNLEKQVEQDIITILKSHMVARLYPVINVSAAEGMAGRNNLTVGMGTDGFFYFTKEVPFVIS